MRFLHSLLSSLLLSSACLVSAVSSWGFEDATLTVQSKGAGVGGGLKEKLSASSPLSKPVSLGATDTLKIILTTTDGKKAKRPHQAFLTLTDTISGLEDSYVFSIKETGKGKLELTHKDLPTQFLTSTQPLSASLIVASFGVSTPYKSKVFSLDVTSDPNQPLVVPSPPVRYHKLDEIHHIFRPDQKSPPKIITLVFTLAVLTALPILLGTWVALGANVNHLGKALGSAPVSHALFYCSIVALEGVFMMYYLSWNLFQTLPAAAVLGVVMFLSGSSALTEVQERRLAGLR
ncbi:hypothetical protein K432DRAFT_444597 [Lepidopterella palustris CBS 459.81]|uniref:Ribophorin II C-terminal domain-containing protein n=1 Tax=Lepidopterella palustris CBS 459.81 TaxID=1314670 RepID=A0A8E2E755_9PEZI|nr:hypothetical protein K432DRAFT_444597 [Lepidopterella palustris CBS 459.81]